ncbi:cytochrome P450 [Humibacillus xanthopallidus]|uniref:Cytochrome P450 n=1 Tax=Humibacillus xanthopallidus TaxID=412689 RepID=A0A543PT31_9MICO|nr:cytochrome P450 [Humibacillus xanthopallidus]TQN47230.1 cytochrome P450 [Humibacillus xanthopallidus]
MTPAVSRGTQAGVAGRHERAVIRSASPALGALVAAARLGPRIVRVPRLGWVVRDPLLIRELLVDHRSTSLLGEGGVGHLWSQVLGDWVEDLFDGAGHHSLRTRARDLFTEAAAHDLVAPAASPVTTLMTQRLTAGTTVDVADLARVLVGRIVVAMLGIDVTTLAAETAETAETDAAGAAGAAGLDHDDGWGAYRLVFARGEELAALALGTQSDTTLQPETIDRARQILDDLTAGVPRAYRTAPESTVLGRCRALGVTEQEATGLASLLLVAGTETAASAIARTAALLADTGQAARLAAATGSDRDDLVEVAVREGLRVTTPAPVIGRHITRDVSVGGRTLRAGDRVLALTYVANTAPGAFDLDRPYLPGNRHLWFGAGRHLCLGAAVARAELRQVIAALAAAGPWTVVDRQAARRVLIPTYRSLVVRRAV